MSTATQQQINVKADDRTLMGLYTNAAQVHFQKEEFVVDFMSQLPPQIQLLARMLMSPAHAKRMSAVLADAVKRYEAQFGPIAEGAPSNEIGFATK